jgi:hypothetical protein
MPQSPSHYLGRWVCVRNFRFTTATVLCLKYNWTAYPQQHFREYSRNTTATAIFLQSLFIYLTVVLRNRVVYEHIADQVRNVDYRRSVIYDERESNWLHINKQY